MSETEGARVGSAPRRDIVVIGGSAGALDALLQLVGNLPSDLPASLLVVVHQSPEHRSLLAELLTRRGSLRAEQAVDGRALEPGLILVAPPDHHLVVSQGRVGVNRGPRENGHRPAVDPLFRSAASVYGGRVIAVVLSGGLDCGTEGALVVKARGGVVIAQQPDDAAFASMPESVIRHARPDHVVPAAGLAELISRLVGEPAPAPEAAAAESDPPASAFDVVCPLCSGAMTQSRDGEFVRVRCHVGHAFSLQALVHGQFQALETALWAGVRALEESARVARRAASTGARTTAPLLEERAKQYEEHADTLRRMLTDERWSPPPDAPPTG